MSILFKDVPYFSGYINVGKAGGEMFYWYFPVKSQPRTATTPFLLWLTGGPGCSSELAALTENGPWFLQDNGVLLPNQNSWHQLGDVVYVDQPLGTGFSTVGDPRNYVTNEVVVAQDMLEFLEKFVDLYSYLRQKPFYLTGESYAGHYIPSIASALLQSSLYKNVIRLEGVAIGNGWVDPVHQIPSYAQFAYEHNLITERGSLIAQKALEHCIHLIKVNMWFLATVECNLIISSLVGDTNTYDVRLPCEFPPLCYNTTSLDIFMNSKDVLFSLHAHKQWAECNPVVSALMIGDWATQTSTKVANLLTAGVQVLVYNGDMDFICNWRGGLAWVNQIPWEKKDEFATLKFSSFNMNNVEVGEVKTLDNLSFIRIYNAGHMVPMDQPEVALFMMKQFVNLPRPITELNDSGSDHNILHFRLGGSMKIEKYEVLVE